MARLEVVPWSIARTCSFAMCGLLSAFGWGSGRWGRGRRPAPSPRTGSLPSWSVPVAPWPARRFDWKGAPDEEVVDVGADRAADERPDDRHPEIEVAVGRLHGGRPPRDPGGQPRPEVTGRVDRIPGQRAEAHADHDHRQADDERGHVGARGGVAGV